MAGDTELTIIGNLTADPELRFIPSGAAVSNFTVASTPRSFDRQANEWKDGETIFMRCSVWRDQAEHVANSLKRGMRIIVRGKLRSRSYQTQQGENRTVMELDVDEVGASLYNADVEVRRAERQQQAPQQGGYQGQGPGDPWAQAAAHGQANAEVGQQHRQQQAPPQQQPPQQGGWGQPPQQPQQGGWGQPPQAPPQQGGWGQPQSDRPPF